MSQATEQAFSSTLWSLILEPAWIGVDAAASPLRTDARAWIALFETAGKGAFSKACGVSVHVEPLVVPPSNMRPAVGMVIHNGPGNPAAAVVLDIPAARALVDAVMTRYISLRGDGPLSAPEAGIAEFLALDVLDTLARAEPKHASKLILAQALVGEEPCRVLLNARGRTPLWFSITCAGKSGTVAVSVDAPFGPPPPLPEPDPSRLAELCIALPSFQIMPEELRGISQGDCVLLGWQNLDAVPGCTVLTNTGWHVGQAENVRDTAAGLTASVRWAGEPSPFGTQPSSSSGVAATVCIARAAMPLGQLAQRSGLIDHMVFSKDPVSPAWLWAQGRCMARGELCLVQGEAALRILETTLDPSLP